MWSICFEIRCFKCMCNTWYYLILSKNVTLFWAWSWIIKWYRFKFKNKGVHKMNLKWKQSPSNLYYKFLHLISCHRSKKKSFYLGIWTLKENCETHILQWLDLASWCWFKTKPSYLETVSLVYFTFEKWKYFL